jgi:hypothetical protein
LSGDVKEPSTHGRLVPLVAQPYIHIQESYIIHPLRHIYFLDGDAGHDTQKRGIAGADWNDSDNGPFSLGFRLQRPQCPAGA